MELAEKLDLLFENFRRPDGKKYSYLDVQNGTDGAMTAGYVWKLHTGKGTNPSYKTLEAICRFFDVPIDYFASDETVSPERYARELKIARALRKAGVEQVALRVSDLDEAARRDIMAMIEYARRAQGLKGEPIETETTQPDQREEDGGGET